MRITIGMTVFNEGDYLTEAWNSVLEQTEISWKAIMILDGKAEKKTEQNFDNISHPSLKKIKLTENHGPYYCRTLAINNTDTDWYCHLDADDRIPPQMIINILTIINKFSHRYFTFLTLPLLVIVLVSCVKKMSLRVKFKYTNT